MTTRTTGMELKKFYNDKSFWPDSGEGTWHDDEYVTADGVVVENIDSIADSAVVTVEGGVVFSPKWDKDDAPSFETYFKRWRKAQNTVVLSVEVPKEKLDAVKTALKALGVKA